MIIGKDIQPERKLYFLGGRVLELLQKSSQEEDLISLYHTLNDKEISINVLLLTLDWLFLLGVIKISKGKIIKCF
jgi:hypothetical protein